MEKNIPFNIGGLVGTMKDSLYWENSKGSNDEPFVKLGVDKIAYCRTILGYTPEDGRFPYCRTMEDLRKLCEALDNDLQKKFEVDTSHGFKVGDWVEILKGRTNFNDEMGKLVGQKFQIKRINDHYDTSDCSITFDGGGFWEWRLSQGHFKKIDPSLITDSENSFSFWSPIKGAVKGDFKQEGKCGWYWDNRSGSNTWPLSECSFDPYDTQKMLLGYSTGSGSFPYCRTKEDLISFCRMLHLKRQQYFQSKPSKIISPADTPCVPEETKKSALVTPILIKVCKI